MLRTEFEGQDTVHLGFIARSWENVPENTKFMGLIYYPNGHPTETVKASIDVSDLSS